jgi:hypothetical protein
MHLLEVLHQPLHSTLHIPLARVHSQLLGLDGVEGGCQRLAHIGDGTVCMGKVLLHMPLQLVDSLIRAASHLHHV